MDKKAVGIIIVIVVVLGGWYLFSAAPVRAPSVQTQTGSPVSNATSTNVTITYTDKGFSPANSPIVFGATVTFVNNSSHKMWVASDAHPDHTGYDKSSKDQHCASGYTGAVPFDQCSTGQSYRFTFTKAGIWRYHNHAAPEDGGTIIVVEPPPAPKATN